MAMKCKLNSPPKPTRILQVPIPFTPVAPQKMATSADKCVHKDVTHVIQGATCNQNKDEFVASSSTLEGQLLDQALETVQSLPEVCQHVDLLQRNQNMELKQQQQILAFKNEKLDAAKEKRLQIKEEVDSLQRRIYMTEEDLKSVRQSIKNLSFDIKNSLVSKRDLEIQLSDKTFEHDKKISLLDEYRKKMIDYEKTVTEEAKSSAIFQTLVQCRENVRELQEQKYRLDSDSGKMSGVACNDYDKKIQDELQQYKDLFATLQEEVTTIQEEIKHIKEKKTTVKKAIEVLHKRNAAKLTRLRKQLREVQTRNRHWKEQVAKLRAKINNLKQQGYC